MPPERRRDKIILLISLSIVIPAISLGYALLVYSNARTRARPVTTSPATGSSPAWGFGPVSPTEGILGGIALVVLIRLGFVAARAWREFDKAD